MLDEIPQWLVEWQRESTAVEHRLGTLDDVVQTVAFSAEERSRWVSGQCVSASGGFLMW